MEPKLEAILEIADEVLDEWKGKISTHYDGCWVRHAECLAFYVKMIATREENE